MNEQETAELFNRELDALLQGRAASEFAPDRGAMALAGALASADFSGQSLIKERLRARLSVKEGGGLPAALRRAFCNNYLRAALAAAVLVVALLPLARRAGHAPEIAVPAAVARLPLQAPPAGAGLPRGARAKGLFASIPMAVPAAEPINDFPIAPAGAGSPITLAAGREVILENGSAIVFETGGAVFALERRAVTQEEIFERRVI